MTPGLDRFGRGFTLNNWLEPPFNRHAFQRVRQLVPTALIRNRSGHIHHLRSQPKPVGEIMVDRRDGTTSSFATQLTESFCDAICVVHRNNVIFEQYFNGMQPETPHLLMSVSKSVCGATLGIAVGRGLIATTDLVCDVAPEFAGTSLEGATVQQVVDMTAGTEFVEDYDLYDDPSADWPLIEYERQAGYRPMDGATPIGTLAHFRTYGTAFAHGSRFQYRSPLSNVSARIVEVANGQSFADVVSEQLWAPLGQEFDADVMVDCLGNPVVEGGVSATVRDLARFGLAHLNDGLSCGSPVIPEAWIADTFAATDDGVSLFAASEYAAPNWQAYRNAFWVFERDQVMSGLGIFGQYCYIHRPSQTVIARFSTYPRALPTDLSDETLSAFATVCAELS